MRNAEMRGLVGKEPPFGVQHDHALFLLQHDVLPQAKGAAGRAEQAVPSVLHPHEGACVLFQLGGDEALEHLFHWEKQRDGRFAPRSL